MTLRVERVRTAETQDVSPDGASASKPRPSSEQAKLGAGSAALVSRHESRQKAAATSAEQRIEAARRAIHHLAGSLPGHDVDVEALAARFGGASHENQDKIEIAAQASYAFMQAALRAHPELADRAIALRTTGASATDRQIIALGVAAKGAQGLAKYAEAERMLAALRPFDAEQRKDILGLMRAGASFDAALGEERAALRDIEASAKRPRAPSLATQRAAAIQHVQRDASAWKQVSQHMNTAIRSVPKLDRSAELAVGAGAATGTVGSIVYNGAKSVVTGDGAHLERAARDAGNAGGYLAGELSQKIAQADRLFVEFSALHVKYAEQSQRLERAIASGDYPTINDAASRLKSLSRDMTAKVRAFDAVAVKIGEMNADFDAAAAHAAQHLALSAISAGLPGHLVKSVGQAVTEGVKHAAQEAAILDVYGKLTH